jgi:hypothetical protein
MTGDRDRRAMEFTVEELREFLEGDYLDVPVDPEFKERLRRKLWELVRERRWQRRADENDT